MKASYFLGLDVAKHKVRAALRGPDQRLLFETDLPVVRKSGLDELNEASPAARRRAGCRAGAHREATGVLHLNWAGALTKAGYPLAVINPLIARRLYTLENSIRDQKSDPVDARSLCAIAALHGDKLLARYRFSLQPERLALQRLQTVRKALRNALTNLKKTTSSLLDPELPGVGCVARDRRHRHRPITLTSTCAGGHRTDAALYFGKELDAAPKGHAT